MDINGAENDDFGLIIWSSSYSHLNSLDRPPQSSPHEAAKLIDLHWQLDQKLELSQGIHRVD